MLAQTLRDRTGPLVGLLRQRAPGLDRIDQLGGEVHRLQQRVGNLRPVGQGPVAHPVQQILARGRLDIDRVRRRWRCGWLGARLAAELALPADTELDALVEALAARFHCGESRIKTTLLRTRRKLKEHLIKEGYCEA